jgi:putative hydrolase of the HAD superfamily
MVSCIFFDLGDTLIQYYTREQWKLMYPMIYDDMYHYLQSELQKSRGYYWLRMQEENYENKDSTVRTLESRLKNIFEFTDQDIDRTRICDVFIKRIIGLSRIYNDTVPILETLAEKYKMAIISNMPWGAPKRYFIGELDKYNILKYFKEQIFCTDIGYRKPHSKIFEYALLKMNMKPEESIMIGDRYEWDILGAQKCNIKGILIDRENKNEKAENCKRIGNLSELPLVLYEMAPT